MFFSVSTGAVALLGCGGEDGIGMLSHRRELRLRINGI
jgi:hypothetical protein